jgi:hypothetical protein
MGFLVSRPKRHGKPHGAILRIGAPVTTMRGALTEALKSLPGTRGK